MKKIIAFLAIFAAVAMARQLTEKEYQTAFTEWMQTHKKSYHHDEFQYRFRVFKTNMDYITSYNARKNGVTLKMNQFGDLPNAEYARLLLGVKPKTTLKPSTKQTPTAGLPNSWDWRSKGAVTPVKDQGQCGSCWSFSTTGSVEGCHKIAGGKLVGLSEQNLIDCSVAQGDEGCNGGLMTDAMTYIISNGGIDTEASYPYTATGPNNCQYSTSSIGATMKSYVNVNSGDEGDLQQKVYTGPTSVAIDASQSSFQFYSSGVYSDPNCSTTQLDHGVLAVGWGHDAASGDDYWIVKNSWNTSWGNNGYIWMLKGQNECGIATMATLPQC